MEKLFRSDFQQLSTNDSQALLKGLRLPSGFSFNRFEKYERFGQSTDTAVYEYEQSEFVFVPGDTVTLGWDSFTVGMDARTREDLMKALSEWGVEDIESFLKESMSPVRKVKIGPMLVECKFNDIGWRRVTLDSDEILSNKHYQKAINEFQTGKYKEYIVSSTLRLRANGGEVTADVHEVVSYDEFIRQIIQSGFRLPTEDEWEYLCGGGSRTLFRWGDSFDYGLHLHHFERATPEKKEYDLEKPNQFGLSIAYDPYKFEIVMDSKHYLKGGDGGCNICGGLGLVLGYLPVATYHRDPGINGGETDFEEICDDFTFYRRIIRL